MPADVEEAHPLVQPVGDAPPSVQVLLVGAPAWCAELAGWCHAEGYTVTTAGADGVRLDEEGHDIVVVDLDAVAIDVVGSGRLAPGPGAVPVLATTASRQAEDLVVDAYRAGADQVVLGPLRQRELIARIRSLLRRASPVTGSPSAPPPGADGGEDDITLDASTQTAIVGAASVRLTPREAEVLRALLARPGRVVTRTELAARDPEGRIPGAVDGVVRCLRTKLEAVEGSRRIVTVRGVGFRLLPHALPLAPPVHARP